MEYIIETHNLEKRYKNFKALNNLINVVFPAPFFPISP